MSYLAWHEKKNCWEKRAAKKNQKSLNEEYPSYLENATPEIQSWKDYKFQPSFHSINSFPNTCVHFPHSNSKSSISYILPRGKPHKVNNKTSTTTASPPKKNDDQSHQSPSEFGGKTLGKNIRVNFEKSVSSCGRIHPKLTSTDTCSTVNDRGREKSSWNCYQLSESRMSIMLGRRM